VILYQSAAGTLRRGLSLEFDYKKSLIKNNFWVTLGHIFVYAKGIILLPLLIKNIGVSLYGAYSLITSYIGLIYGISSFGIGFKYQRFIPAAKEVGQKRGLFYFQLFFQFFSIAILSLLILSASGIFNNIFIKEEVNYSVLLACGLLFSTFLVSQSCDYFRYTHRMVTFSVATTVTPYLNILLIVMGIVIFKRIDINFLLFVSTVAMTLTAIPLSYRVIREIGFEIPRFTLAAIAADIKLGLPIVLSYVVEFVIAGSDRFVIGYYMSPRQVGYYNPAYTLGALVIMFPRIMGVVLPPLLSKAVDENEEQTAQVLLRHAVKIYILLVVPFIAGSFVLSHVLLRLLANQEVADAAYLITPLITLGILFYGLNIILAHGVAFVKMKTKIIFYSNVIAGLLSIVMNIVLIYFFRSIIVAAIVSLFSFFVSFLFLHVNTKKLIRIEYDKTFIMKVVLASVLMGLYIRYSMLLVNSKPLTVFLLISSGIILYFVIIFVTRAFSKNETNFMRNYVLSLVRK
jgi:O-antigen/teichoic acid export membrane protein